MLSLHKKIQSNWKGYRVPVKVKVSRIRYIVSKGPKYRFPSRIDFKKCREEIASALNDFGNRWCKREYVEPNALKE